MQCCEISRLVELIDAPHQEVVGGSLRGSQIRAGLTSAQPGSRHSRYPAEAIKIPPLVLAAERDGCGLAMEVVVTGQHANVATETLRSFGVTPNHQLECRRPTGGGLGGTNLVGAAEGSMRRTFSRTGGVGVAGHRTTLVAGRLGGGGGGTSGGNGALYGAGGGGASLNGFGVGGGGNGAIGIVVVTTHR